MNFYLNFLSRLYALFRSHILNAFDVLQLPKTHIDLFLGVSVCSSNKPAIMDEGGIWQRPGVDRGRGSHAPQPLHAQAGTAGHFQVGPCQ